MLSVLRAVPVWLFAGLALACAAILYLPALGVSAADQNAFLGHWGAWARVGMIGFACLAIARAAADLIIGYRKRKLKKSLAFVPRDGECWWHLAKQNDDTYVSQVALRIDVSNQGDNPLVLFKVRLVRPIWHGKILAAMATLPNAHNLHSSNHPVPARAVSMTSVHFMVRGKLAWQARPLKVVVAITDQTGARYRIAVKLASRDKPLGLARRIADAWIAFRGRLLPSAAAPIPAVRTHDGRFGDVDAILNEEMRQYVANGRQRGGLGSLNVTLQSEPNNGWTQVGAVPNLLWSRDDGQPAIGSTNLDRLVRAFNDRDPAAQGGLVEYLLSHLNRASPFASVAYFNFMALHRAGRTVAAVAAAQRDLSGDREHAYSNLLGVLSGLVSREYFNMEPALLDALQQMLANEAEHNFRLNEKLNLARLLDMDERARERG
ncbi:TPA: hypothetical protein QDA89_000985 [Burkholderia vietnamiensis]|uniref:hypothetical protein n=1 Tax=Burkholderia vietnamiensis TaxID=60552 RepID=UPI00264BB0D7|nr:hypothetical protein [Burkholderia vietnamiensis]MDN8075307.1 hypothetical protein [Burkholderia vietnamiensis]HDR8982114.1 hypothetical protein [Burkholderia vietnamiensis]